MSEEIGKHKGAVETLLHEKKELSRLLQIVNSQLQRHLQALEENGIDAEEFMNQLQDEQQQTQQQRKKQQKSRQKRSQNKKRRQDRNQNRNSDDDEEFDLGNHLE